MYGFIHGVFTGAPSEFRVIRLRDTLFGMKFVYLLKEACRIILSPTLQSVQTAAMLLLPFHLSSDFMYSK
jgi:hypothetical protein